MSYKIQIFTLEIELHKIRVQKTIAVEEKKYEVAIEFRELEKAKSKEICDFITILENRFNAIEISAHNFDELKELSDLIFFYQNNGNPLITKKIKLAIKNLKIQKEEALLIQNFKLRKEFNKEIEYLKNIAKH